MAALETLMESFETRTEGLETLRDALEPDARSASPGEKRWIYFLNPRPPVDSIMT